MSSSLICSPFSNKGHTNFPIFDSNFRKLSFFFPIWNLALVRVQLSFALDDIFLFLCIPTALLCLSAGKKIMKTVFFMNVFYFLIFGNITWCGNCHKCHAVIKNNKAEYTFNVLE